MLYTVFVPNEKCLESPDELTKSFKEVFGDTQPVRTCSLTVLFIEMSDSQTLN